MIQHILRGFLVLALIFFSGASRAELSISNVPLFLGTTIPPNIMLILDSSGSMSNVVPDVPYNPNTIYSCSGATLWSMNNQVDILITSTGIPYISFDIPNTSSDHYDWGRTSSGTGATNRVKRCFDPTASYTARLHGNGGGATSTKSPDGYLPAEYIGNYLNWYFGTNTSNAYGDTASNFGNQARIKPGAKSRLMIAQNASRSLVDSLDDVRLGLSTYNSSSGDGGQLREAIGNLDATKRAVVKTAISAVTATGMTPLAETLADVGFYFSRGATNLTLHPVTNPTVASRTNIFSTNSSTYVPVSGDRYTRHSSWSNGSDPIQYYCQKSFSVLLTDGRATMDRGVSTLLRDYDGDCVNANPACNPIAYDMKSNREYESSSPSDFLDDVAQALYEMDLRPDLPSGGKPTGMKNNLATYLISFADKQALEDPLMPEVAAQGGGKFLIAGNESELTSAFKAATDDIIEKVSSGSALATNSTRLDTNRLVYQAQFNSSDWSGELTAYNIGYDTGLISDDDYAWKSSQTGKIPAHGSRKILSMVGNDKVEFKWSALSTSQRTTLGTLGITEDILNWVRGDQSKEVGKTGGTLRKRTKLLGDIVNSDPFYVPGAGSRPAMLYVGANDGMLHAFEADTGVEKFAYIPKAVLSNLDDLASTSYTHQYFVDGSPQVFDVDGALILVGTTGAGGRSVFALDVTDPTNPSTKWEFTDDNLGFTLGQPTVGRLQDGTWVAIFGNGYNSNNHRAFLYVVNLATGVSISGAPIDTGAGSAALNNGLASPAPLADANGKLVVVYAGDLLGNLWKFDLTSNSVAFSGTPLFIAKDASNATQPITASLEIAKHPDGGYLVIFGTGKYFEVTDHSANDSTVQSFYGIWDKPGEGVIPDRSVLLEQEIVGESTEVGNTWRLVSNNAGTGTERGWYVDLNKANGERVTDKPILLAGKVIFTTQIPFAATDDPCKPGGTTWIMAVNMLTGGSVSTSVFDVNRDSQFDNFDFVTVRDENGQMVTGVASGFQAVTAGMAQATLMQSTTGNYDVLLSGISDLTTSASSTKDSSGAAATAASVVAAAAKAAANTVIDAATSAATYTVAQSEIAAHAATEAAKAAADLVAAGADAAAIAAAEEAAKKAADKATEAAKKADEATEAAKKAADTGGAADVAAAKAAKDAADAFAGTEGESAADAVVSAIESRGLIGGLSVAGELQGMGDVGVSMQGEKAGRQSWRQLQ